MKKGWGDGFRGETGVYASKSPEVAITMLLDLISLERERNESMNRL